MLQEPPKRFDVTVVVGDVGVVQVHPITHLMSKVGPFLGKLHHVLAASGIIFCYRNGLADVFLGDTHSLFYTQFYCKYFENYRKFVVWAMIGLAGVIVTVDIMGVDERYINDAKWHNEAPTEVKPTAAYREILKDKTLGYRVFDIDHQGTAYASNFCRSVDGYHGAKLGRYNDVLNRYIYPVNPNVLNMLNTRYVIVGGQAKQYDPFGAAWFVGDVKMVDTPAEALDELEHNDLWETAIVERGDVEDLSTEYSGYDWAEIELVKYAPNYLKYEYEAPEESLCVFSEIYYPEGWTAYVDGKEADYFAVDYILRGMVLPEGKHIVEWRFRAPNWGMATTITGIASWLILLSFVALAVVPAVRWVINRRSDKKKIE